MEPALSEYLRSAQQLLSVGYNPVFVLGGFFLSFITSYLISKNSIIIALIFSLLITLAIAAFIVVFNLSQVEVLT